MDIVLEFLSNKIEEIKKIVTSSNKEITYLTSLKEDPTKVIDDKNLSDELKSSDIRELQLLYQLLSNNQYDRFSNQPQVKKSIEHLNELIDKKIGEVQLSDENQSKLDLLDKCYSIIVSYNENSYIDPKDVDIISAVYDLYIQNNNLPLQLYIEFNKFLFNALRNNANIESTRKKEVKVEPSKEEPKEEKPDSVIIEPIATDEKFDLVLTLSKDESKEMLKKKIAKSVDPKVSDGIKSIKGNIRKRFTKFQNKQEDNSVYKKILSYIDLAKEILDSDLNIDYELIYNEKSDEYIDLLEPSDGLYLFLSLRLIDYYNSKDLISTVGLIDRFKMSHAIEYMKKNPKGFEEYIKFIDSIKNYGEISSDLNNYISSHQNDNVSTLTDLIKKYSEDPNLQTFQYTEFLAVIYQLIVKTIESTIKSSTGNNTDELFSSDVQSFLNIYMDLGKKVYAAIISGNTLVLQKEETPTPDNDNSNEPPVILNIDDRDYFINKDGKPTTQNIFCFPGLAFDKDSKADRYKNTIFREFLAFDASIRGRVYGGFIDVLNQLYENKDYETKQGGEPKYFSEPIVKKLKEIGLKYIRPGVSQADFRIHAITRESAFLKELGYGTGKITFIGAIGPNDDNKKDKTYKRNAGRVIERTGNPPVLHPYFDYIEHITRGYIPKEFFSESDKQKAHAGKFNGDTSISLVDNGRERDILKPKAEGKRYSDEHYYAYYTVLDKDTINNVNDWLYDYFVKNSELMFDIYEDYKNMGLGGL